MHHILPYRNVFPKLEDDVYLAAGACVIGDVVIGSRSSIWCNTVVRGDMHYIRIGRGTNVQDNATLHVTAVRFPLQIGDRVTVGHRAIVHGSTVEDDCLIGMGAIILDGARISRGSLVAAGALVPPGFFVPPESVVMGVPAKVIRTVGSVEREMIHASAAHYVELAVEYLQAAAAGKTPALAELSRHPPYPESLSEA
jgi:carbonic anhydrase/acetyltransferase-like protein (isoleucine patch superfamily)